ncbi:hypothetical protein DIPPA_19589 [Diplonema papillatum]|nr:hypothetical protein DIPPA_19589 [Diplonema papillatum]
MRRDVATVVECLFCKSHVVTPVHVLDTERFQQRPGWPAKPQDQQQEFLVEVQAHVASLGYVTRPCPFCVELCTGRPWADFVSAQLDRVPTDAKEAYTPFFPCKFVSYDPTEPPPVYVDSSPHPGSSKPKWTLSEGVGPPTLELDRSHSGKLYKKSYRACGLTGDLLSSVEIQAADEKSGVVLPTQPQVAAAQALFDQAYWKAGENVTKLLGAIHQHFCPVLLSIEDFTIEMQAIKDDPFEALRNFLERYPPPDAGAAAAPGGSAPSKDGTAKPQKQQQQQPPPTAKKANSKPAHAPYREGRERGDKREQARLLAADIQDQYETAQAFSKEKKR